MSVGMMQDVITPSPTGVYSNYTAPMQDYRITPTKMTTIMWNMSMGTVEGFVKWSVIAMAVGMLYAQADNMEV